MTLHIGRRAASTAAILALGALGAVGVPAAANAATSVTATYTCHLPTGDQSGDFTADVTLDPAAPTSGGAVNVTVDLTSIPFTAPVQINSYDATLAINVSGAETSSFNVTKSSSTPIPANSPITVTGMAGTWTPSAAGSDTLAPGTATVNANVAILGNVTVTCEPSGSVPGVPVTVG
ncbi:MAG TPA: hypothetical protein VGL93_07140 [Streptosporangiaceae bacterium]|jgi:hypothetical protein